MKPSNTIVVSPKYIEEKEHKISDLGKKVERLQEQLNETNKTILDQELIIKRLKRRRICTNQKEKARKEHINELIAQVKELKEEVARRGRLINELKSQRKEANEVIKEIYDRTLNSDWSKESNKLFEITEKYLEKWGVK